MGKKKELKKLLKQLPESSYQNVVASNSTIKREGKEFYIWTGGINPKFKGSFEEVKEYLTNEVNQQSFEWCKS